MKKLLIYSKCISVKKNTQFHFKGFYNGQRINEITVCNSVNFIQGCEYLLWVRDLKVENKELFVELIAWKLVCGKS